MIVQESFIKKLRAAFDLNIYEAKIWTALLSKGIATAGELADISNVPRSRAYDVLESLEKRSFIVMKLGKPIRYIAVKPEEVIKRVKKTFLEKAGEKVKAIDEVGNSNFYKELNVLFKNGISHVDPTTISGSIKGRTNLYNHIISMLEKSKKSVVIVTSKNGLIRKADNLKHVLKKLSKKGIKVRIAAPIDKDNEKIAKELKDIADVKSINDINARFVLVDSNELLFMLNDDENTHESYDSGIWVNSPFFVKALSSMFESNWDKL